MYLLLLSMGNVHDWISLLRYCEIRRVPMSSSFLACLYVTSWRWKIRFYSNYAIISITCLLINLRRCVRASRQEEDKPFLLHFFWISNLERKKTRCAAVGACHLKKIPFDSSKVLSVNKRTFDTPSSACILFTHPFRNLSEIAADFPDNDGTSHMTAHHEISSQSI